MEDQQPLRKRRRAVEEEEEEEEGDGSRRDELDMDEEDVAAQASPIRASSRAHSVLEETDPDMAEDAFAHAGTNLSRALRPVHPTTSSRRPQLVEALRTIDQEEARRGRQHEMPADAERAQIAEAANATKLKMELRQAQERARAAEEVLQRKEWEWTKARLEKESEMNRLEWELRKEREKVQILLRPSAGAASPTAAIAARPAEVKELKASKEMLEKRVSELEKDNLVLSEKYAEEQINAKNTKTQLENKIHKLTQSEDTLRAENEALTNQVEALTKQLSGVHEEAETVIQLKDELAKAQDRIKVLSANSDINAEAASLIDAMQEELSRMVELEGKNKALETENAQLRQRLQNTQILQDEIDRLTAKYERARKDLESHSQLQVEYENLVQQTAKWESYFGDLKQFESPNHIARIVEDLQRKNEILTEKCGQLSAEAKRAQNMCRTQEVRAVDAKKEADKYRRELDEMTEKNARQELELNILRKDKRSYQELLETYDRDIREKNYDKAKDERIESLEEQLERQEELVAKLRTELEASNARNLSLSSNQTEPAVAADEAEDGAMSASLKSENEALRLANEKLGAELEKLNQELAAYEMRLGKGDYNPATTKILHLINNPTALARKKNSEVELLRQENSALRDKLASFKRELKEGQTTAMDLEGKEEGEGEEETESGKRLSAAESLRIKILQEENEVLRQQAKDNEVTNKRLMKIFKDKTREFRETVYQLFGWRVDYTEERSIKRYRLKSMYAEKETDELIFQKTSKGDLELLANDFSLTLDVEVQAFLSRCHSIPGFLANITLSLFDKQTFQG